MPCVHQRLQNPGPCENCASHTTEKYQSKIEIKFARGKIRKERREAMFVNLIEDFNSFTVVY